MSLAPWPQTPILIPLSSPPPGGRPAAPLPEPSKASAPHNAKAPQMVWTALQEGIESRYATPHGVIVKDPPKRSTIHEQAITRFIGSHGRWA